MMEKSFMKRAPDLHSSSAMLWYTQYHDEIWLYFKFSVFSGHILHSAELIYLETWQWCGFPEATDFTPYLPSTEQILGLRPANERRRYIVTPSFIGWAQA